MQTLPSSPNANAASGLVVESELFPAPQEHLKSVQPNAMEAQQYDPLAIAAYYGRRPFQVVGRLLTIFWSFFGFALSLWWDRQRGKGERNQHRRAVRLREIRT